MAAAARRPGRPVCDRLGVPVGGGGRELKPPEPGRGPQVSGGGAFHWGCPVAHLTLRQTFTMQRHTSTPTSRTHVGSALAGVMTLMDAGSRTERTNAFGRSS